MPVAYHIVFGTYGFWLPNDPRGSGSDYVYSERLREFGPATKVHTTRSVAHRPHDNQLRQAAKEALEFPAVRFNGRQALAVSKGFRQVVASAWRETFALATKILDRFSRQRRRRPPGNSLCRTKSHQRRSIAATLVLCCSLLTVSSANPSII